MKDYITIVPINGEMREIPYTPKLEIKNEEANCFQDRRNTLASFLTPDEADAVADGKLLAICKNNPLHPLDLSVILSQGDIITLKRA